MVVLNREGENMSEFDQAIGRNLRRMRVRAGLTQQGLAGHLGVTFQQVQKYENGKNRLPLESLYRLANLFKAPVDSFFRGIGLPKPEEDDPHLLRLYQTMAGVRNKALRHKIVQVVDILAS
jgi:transcriptional regulator with XRE-family HTH domain